jgi:hypothetical protein
VQPWKELSVRRLASVVYAEACCVDVHVAAEATPARAAVAAAATANFMVAKRAGVVVSEGLGERRRANCRMRKTSGRQALHQQPSEDRQRSRSNQRGSFC